MHRFTLSRSETEQIRQRLRAANEPREEVWFAYLHGSFLLEVPCEDIDYHARQMLKEVLGG